MNESTTYNVVTIPSMFGSTCVFACRRCGALVPMAPADYADQHSRWHAALTTDGRTAAEEAL